MGKYMKQGPKLVQVSSGWPSGSRIWVKFESGWSGSFDVGSGLTTVHTKQNPSNTKFPVQNQM